MITFSSVSVTYDGADASVWSDASFSLQPGAFHLVVGPTGSGKSTLLGLMNGHVPHFTGGTVSGSVEVGGRSVATHRPRDFADLVGVVRQNPRSGFVTATVLDELVYAMENLGFSRDAMQGHLEVVGRRLRVDALLERPLATLSGGQAQRVAIAAALMAGPSIVVLDEPTSGLDPDAASEVLDLLVDLVHDHHMTVVCSEHRVERVLDLAASVVIVEDGRVWCGAPAAAMERSSIVPPVVEVGRAASWTPLPLTVAEATPFADSLRVLLPRAPEVSPPTAQRSVADLSRASVHYGDLAALDAVTLEIHAGEVLGLMGPNGAGKSTLLGVLSGLVALGEGTCTVGGADPLTLQPADLVRRVGLIPQDPGLLLYAASVGEECRSADVDGGLTPGTTEAWFARFQPSVDLLRHPRDLSEGQRLCLALAVICASEPPVLLLDEPTCGLDNVAKVHLAEVLADRAAAGAGIVVASHDVEFIAEVASRTVLMDRGVVVADGPARTVLSAAGPHRPQIAQLLSPDPWLTAAEVIAAMGERP